MDAYDAMSVNIVAAKDNASAIEISTRLSLEGLNGIPIIDDDGGVIGIVTAIDILRAMRNGKNLDNLKAKDVMNQNPVVVRQDTRIEEIIDLMDKGGIIMIPVVESDGRIIGVVSRSDILTEKLNERFVSIGEQKIVTKTLGKG
jgi:predicted transcriptional regulator